MADTLKAITAMLGGSVPIFLLMCGAFLTVRLLRYMPSVMRSVIPTLKRQKKGKGERTPLGAFCLALAGTLGVGNISGVAAAIASGGAGAIFWMWVSSLFCAILKYAETVLAVCYRRRGSDGVYVGGAHIYISEGLRAPFLGVLFCILCTFSSFTTGNITQVKAAAESVRAVFGVPEYVCGAIVFFLILIFCRSGSAIYRFTLGLIPILCGGYVLLCISVIMKFHEGLPAVTAMIFSEALTLRAGIGGVLGFIFGRSVRLGITRGVMSNEAGCGTAPIAHASSETEYPAIQGALGIIEVLFDTLVLCTLTAYVILLSGVDTAGEGSAVIAVKAFTSSLGAAIGAPLAISMLLFALGAAASWSYYGRVSLSALGADARALAVYNLSYAICAFFGTMLPEGVIWWLSDISIYLMAALNSLAVICLSSKVSRATAEHCKKSAERMHGAEWEREKL